MLASSVQPAPVWHTLRISARWVLAVFVLAMGLAVLAPLAQRNVPSDLCVAPGSLRAAAAMAGQGDAGGASGAGHAGLQCVLCLLLDAPAPQRVAASITTFDATCPQDLAFGPWVPQYTHPARPGQGPPAYL